MPQSEFLIGGLVHGGKIFQELYPFKQLHHGRPQFRELQNIRKNRPPVVSDTHVVRYLRQYVCNQTAFFVVVRGSLAKGLQTEIMHHVIRKFVIFGI